MRLEKLPGDENALYVTTDGGFLIPHESGIQDAKLVRMEVGESGWPLAGSECDAKMIRIAILGRLSKRVAGRWPTGRNLLGVQRSRYSMIMCPNSTKSFARLPAVRRTLRDARANTSATGNP